MDKMMYRPLYCYRFHQGCWTSDYNVMPHDQYFEGWAQDYGNSNVFLKPLFRGNLDPFVNNANLGAIAHTSNGT